MYQQKKPYSVADIISDDSSDSQLSEHEQVELEDNVAQTTCPEIISTQPVELPLHIDETKGENDMDGRNANVHLRE